MREREEREREREREREGLFIQFFVFFPVFLTSSQARPTWKLTNSVIKNASKRESNFPFRIKFSVTLYSVERQAYKRYFYL